MDYELAKELKDAGFPQGDYSPDYRYEDDGGVFKDGVGAQIQPRVSRVPTLSELIESCGGWFHELVKRDDETWYAGTKLDDNRPRYGTGSGSTPEVAVARLWLALNPRKKKLTTNRDI